MKCKCGKEAMFNVKTCNSQYPSCIEEYKIMVCVVKNCVNDRKKGNWTCIHHKKIMVFLFWEPRVLVKKVLKISCNFFSSDYLLYVG